MASKRPHPSTSTSSEAPSKKPRKGFQVGPANLPDGVYRRKAQQIKGDLIQKAKIRKNYAKIKARQEAAEAEKRAGVSVRRPDVWRDVEDEDERKDGAKEEGANGGNVEGEDEDEDEGEDAVVATLDRHPERQAMLDAPAPLPPPPPQPSAPNPERQDQSHTNSREKRNKRHKPTPYAKELDLAEKRRQEMEARRVAREDRERMRAAMKKARRPGVDGKRKLGRESTVLLEKVRRMV